MKKAHYAAPALLGLLAAVYACENTGTQPPDFSGELSTLTNTVVIPAHTAFAARSDELVTSMQQLQTTTNADSLTKAQTAWRAARAAYRSGDAVHFGPIEDKGIASRIDLAPADPNGIDALANGQVTIDVHTVGAAGGNVKGFLGLEYLLFPSDALTKLSAPGHRLELAVAIAQEIDNSAHELLDAWDPAKGGYANEVINAGKTSKRYPTQRAAFDDFVAGVGYALELVVGVRLAEPLGKKGNGTPDPTQDPTRASDSAVADLTASISGVKALYEGQGFEAMLKAKNTVLDSRAVSEIADCSAKAAAIPTPFANAVLNQTAVVTGAYDSCKTLKTTWNTDLTSALGATLKPGENDGD
jgi:predicted lipoprotein